MNQEAKEKHRKTRINTNTNEKQSKTDEKPMKTIEKTAENQKTKDKPRGNNRNARKSINTVAKPMNMWKNDGEHPPTKK